MWESCILTAGEQGLIGEALLLQATAPPCSGSLVLVPLPGGDIDPVTTLSTSFRTTAITFEQAKRFLDPVNWPACNDFWCEMNPLEKSGNFTTFKEVVSLDCGDQNVWRAETCLKFAMSQAPYRASSPTTCATGGRSQATSSSSTRAR